MRRMILLSALLVYILPASGPAQGLVQGIQGAIKKAAEERALEADPALKEAVEKGDVPKVQKLIKKGANPNGQCEAGPYIVFSSAFGMQKETLLLFAARLGKLEVAKVLLDAGVDVNQRAGQGPSALQLAILSGNSDVAELLIERGANVNDEMPADFTWKKDLEESQRLSSADPSQAFAAAQKLAGLRHDKGSSALGIAAKLGNVKIVKLLLDKGADPVHARVLADATGEAKAVIEQAVVSNPNGQLAKAVKEGNFEAVRAALEKGADPNALGGGSQSPLLNALGHPEIVRLLLEKGADPNRCDPKPASCPLYRASDLFTIPILGNEVMESAKLLIGHGADAEAIAVELDKTAGGLSSADLPPEQRSFAQQFRSAARTLRRLAMEVKNGPQIEAAEKAGDAAATAGQPAKELEHYLEALKLCAGGSASAQRLSEKAIQAALAMDPPPQVPEEAKEIMVRGQLRVKEAKDPSAYLAASTDMQEALRLAPWWASGYYNLGIVQEKTQDYAGAVTSLKLYLRLKPDAPDASSVKTKIYELKARLAIGK